MRIFANGPSAITKCTLNAKALSPRQQKWDFLTDPDFWSSTWQVTKCVASVVLAVVPIFKAAKFVKDLGGIRSTAELLVKAGSWAEVRDASAGLAAEIVGIASIEETCF